MSLLSASNIYCIANTNPYLNIFLLSTKNIYILGLSQLNLHKGDSQTGLMWGFYNSICIKVTLKKIGFWGLHNSIYIKVTPHVCCVESTVWSSERCLEGRVKILCHILLPAVTWHNLGTKTLFLFVLSVVSWISF